MSTRNKMIVAFRVMGIGLVLYGIVVLVRTYQAATSPEAAWVGEMMNRMGAGELKPSLARPSYTPGLLWTGLGVAVAALSSTVVSLIFRGIDPDPARPGTPAPGPGEAQKT
jgi:hypothetical protein